ncbi:hypothetical protein K488DRAFT_71377 [Vararia minispora EC-137]|uniref:Uncharacterized protein n=1 Tax=Vararia minispora EC-137 TaxID=1314806 RepID=A0ACB8QHZ5_9AGAM|nr:hypothetical protein K488DRAFT_71377 [Vararia minispora EC-137]
MSWHPTGFAAKNETDSRAVMPPQHISALPMARTPTPTKMAASSPAAPASRLRTPSPRIRSSSAPRPMSTYHSPRLLTPTVSPPPDLPTPLSTMRKRVEKSSVVRRPAPSSLSSTTKLPRRSPEPEISARKPALRSLTLPSLMKPEDAYPTPPSTKRAFRHVTFFEPDSPSPSPTPLPASPIEDEDRQSSPGSAPCLSPIHGVHPAVVPKSLAKEIPEPDPSVKLERRLLKPLDVRPLRVKARSTPRLAPLLPRLPSETERSLLEQVTNFIEEWRSMFVSENFRRDWVAFLEEKGEEAAMFIADGERGREGDSAETEPRTSLAPESTAINEDDTNKTSLDGAQDAAEDEQKHRRRESPMSAILTILSREESRVTTPEPTNERRTPHSVLGGPPRIPLPRVPPPPTFKSLLPEASTFAGLQNASKPLSKPFTTPSTPLASSIIKSSSNSVQTSPTQAPSSPSFKSPHISSPSSPSAKSTITKKPVPLSLKQSTVHSSPPSSPPSASAQDRQIVHSPRRDTLPLLPSPLSQTSFTPRSLPTDVSPLGLASVPTGLSLTENPWQALDEASEPRASQNTLRTPPRFSGPYLNMKQSSSAYELSMRDLASSKATLTPPMTSALSFSSTSTHSLSSTSRVPLRTPYVPLEHPRAPPRPQSLQPPSISRSSSLLGIRSLFRRSSRVDASEERRRRAESLKSMIGGPQRVSMAGLSVGLAERAIDLTRVTLAEEDESSGSSDGERKHRPT